jgi:hypothetical protein
VPDFNLELLWDQLVGSNAVPVDGYELASWLRGVFHSLGMELILATT